MKKVLSVLLAAAMVMGMSVSAFAATKPDKWETWANTSDEACYHEPTAHDYASASRLSFYSTMKVVHTDGSVEWVDAGETYKNMKVGDTLFFAVWEGMDKPFQLAADKHWSINIKGNEYVKNAEFVRGNYFGTSDNELCVKVEIVDVLDDLDAQNVKFQMYIAENYKGKTSQSAGAKLTYSFDNYTEKYVDFDFTNDVDYMAKWIVRDDEKGTAVFDFQDAAYFTVKMIPEEAVIFNFDQTYDKAIDKAYNEYDADLEFYNFKGTKDEFTKVGELFIPADEDTFIYEYVDGELVEVEAEWVKSYKVGNTSKAKSGWVIETKELGYYVVADEELVVEEAEDNTNSSTSTDKTNPETGANDFVGAAVALAVVSVAAAGALAFKK